MVINMSPNTPPFADSLAALGWNGTPEQRDPLDRPSYVGPVSFSQLPWIEDPAEIRRRKADIAIIGAPFDDAVTHRPGTRFGPRAIREAQYQTGTLHSLQVGVEPFTALTAVDAGDAQV
jgi:arginase family enzyme